MDEHPGDTLGKRFLTGVAIYAVKGMFGPNDGDPLDGGLGKARQAKKVLVTKEQDAELAKYALDKAKGTVTIPPSEAIPYAAKLLSSQKQEKSKMPVPGAATPGTGAHDPNASKFDSL
jgi:hypothetical protein